MPSAERQIENTTKDAVSKRLTMAKQDPLLGKLVEASSDLDTRYFQATFEIPGIHERKTRIEVMETPAVGKETSGDRIVVRSHPRGIYICCFDGVTPGGEIPKEILKAYSETIGEDVKPDQIVWKILTKFPEYIFGDNRGVKESPIRLAAELTGQQVEKLKTDDFWYRFHSNFLSPSPNFVNAVPSFPRNVWRSINDILHIVLAAKGIRPTTYLPSELPGMIGTSAFLETREFIHSENRYHYKDIYPLNHHWLQTADAPILVVTRNGLIKDMSLNTNSFYDTATVKLMRDLIHSGTAIDAVQARKLLFEKNYYQQSYDAKVNSTFGVCNGSPQFNSPVVMGGDMSLNGWFDVLAVIHLTDGVLYYANDFEGGHDKRSRAIISLVRMVLEGKNSEEIFTTIEAEEKITFDPNNPKRERPGDDKALVAEISLSTDQTEAQLQHTIRNLHFAG